MRNIIVCTSKIWDKNLVSDLTRLESDYIFYHVTEAKQLTMSFVKALDPEFIFFPHWSNILKEEIYSSFECVMFHMTDLPFGRGGSPLQNLITRGIRQTKVTAFKCDGGIDTGPVYLKMDLDLDGSAEEIFIRSTQMIKGMILQFLKERPKAVPQYGNPVEFKRRKAEDSEVDFTRIKDLEAVYDHVRMLDAEGYPLAFFDLQGFRFSLSQASFNREVNELKVCLTIKKDENHG